MCKVHKVILRHRSTRHLWSGKSGFVQEMMVGYLATSTQGIHNPVKCQRITEGKFHSHPQAVFL